MRWSISCWSARANSSSPFTRNSLPLRFARLDRDLGRPPHLGHEAGDREAALPVELLSRRAYDLRVDQLGHLLLDLDHRDLERHPDLVGGEPDARRITHRLEHVVEQPMEARIERRHLAGPPRRIGSSAVRMRLRAIVEPPIATDGSEERLGIDVDGHAGRNPLQRRRPIRLGVGAGPRPGTASGPRGGRRTTVAGRAPRRPGRPPPRRPPARASAADPIGIGDEQPSQDGGRRIAEQPPPEQLLVGEAVDVQRAAAAHRVMARRVRLDQHPPGHRPAAGTTGDLGEQLEGALRRQGSRAG